MSREGVMIYPHSHLGHWMIRVVLVADRFYEVADLPVKDAANTWGEIKRRAISVAHSKNLEIVGKFPSAWEILNRDSLSSWGLDVAVRQSDTLNLGDF